MARARPAPCRPAHVNRRRVPAARARACTLDARALARSLAQAGRAPRATELASTDFRLLSGCKFRVRKFREMYRRTSSKPLSARAGAAQRGAPQEPPASSPPGTCARGPSCGSDARVRDARRDVDGALRRLQEGARRGRAGAALSLARALGAGGSGARGGRGARSRAQGLARSRTLSRARAWMVLPECGACDAPPSLSRVQPLTDALCTPCGGYPVARRRVQPQGGASNSGKPRTLAELAQSNKAKGMKSSSGGAAGFASKRKAYIQPEGKYVRAAAHALPGRTLARGRADAFDWLARVHPCAS